MPIIAQENERFSTDAVLELMFGRDPKDEELLQKNVTLDEFYMIGGFAAVAEDAELQKAGSAEASYFVKLADALEKESPILQARFSCSHDARQDRTSEFYSKNPGDHAAAINARIEAFRRKANY